MSNRLEDVLRGQEQNYILPFFWQHGEDGPVLREEMVRLYEAGIKEVCIEARPHPDFMGSRWWHDMDIIMEEARSRGMRVWLLDDDHFPTGHAVGHIKDAPKELRRLFLRASYVDAIGPSSNSSFIVEPNLTRRHFDIGNLLSAVAVQRDSRTGKLTDVIVNVSGNVRDGMLYWNVPEGFWRIFMVYETYEGGAEPQRDYINVLVRESVRVLIDAVYEVVYERYRDDFGQTFAGFFSDEPAFYNDKEIFDFNSTLGKKDVTLPWSQELKELLEMELGSDYRALLPLLWYDGPARTPIVRYTYMNLISNLYARNFTQQLGDWCRQHGVEYIGHVVEDNNVHARLGPGTAHFFRALWGQDMSGVDVVLWQLRPGFDDLSARSVSGEADSEFFNYGLVKMASSLGHIDPKKKGRTMAEVFGAYGWAEGLKLMKWMTDHMLVRGVTHFVPHAFSPKEFPDTDCPPHFYARGKNPQYRYYKVLNDYTNRMSHLLSGGQHIASAAVLYHAEAEWSGEAMYFHKPVRELMRSQIDCDVLPVDTIVSQSYVTEGQLCVNNETYECLIVPFSEALPSAALTRLVELANQRLPVLFLEQLPVRSSDRIDAREALELLGEHDCVSTVELNALSSYLIERGFFEVQAQGSHPFLRHYHIQHPNLDVWLFTNEHSLNHIETNIQVPTVGSVLFYDALRNVAWDARGLNDGLVTTVNLRLAPYESIVILSGDWTRGIQTVEVPRPIHGVEVGGRWSIATATSEEYPTFSMYGTTDALSDMSSPDKLPTFAGTLRYETEFDWTHDSQPTGLDLGATFEVAQVWVNGKSVGVRICPPYLFDIGGVVHRGRNTLTVEVTNTLVREYRDSYSCAAQLEPSGLMGPVRVLY